MDKAQKKLLKSAWKQANKPVYKLTREEAEELFDFVQAQVDEQGCDHTRRFTDEWLKENIASGRHEKIYAEIEDMGGYCDCEVLYNCYEEYDIAIP